MEAGIGHAEGGEEAGLEEFVEGLAGRDFDDAGEDVGIDAVDPLSAGLVEEGDVGDGLRHLGEGFVTVEGLCFLVEGIDWMG